MLAAILRGPGAVAVEHVPDPRLTGPGDAIVRVLMAGICGTDLRGFRGEPGPFAGPRCGHEFVGVVVETGADVTAVRPGDTVVAPFMYADGDCAPCRRGMPTSCGNAAMWGNDNDGGQAEAVRVPYADATLVHVPMAAGDERLPAVLALADVMATGYHAVRAVRAGDHVAVIGDGAVGLCAVLAARTAGAERVFLLGRHESRLNIGRAFGATDVVSVRGAAAVDAVREATVGVGADLVVDAVGEQTALDTGLGLCADGGTLSLVGGPHGAVDPMACFLRNISLSGGLAPARAYLPHLVEQVVAGTLDPSPIFDHTVALADVGKGYALMAERTATKVLVSVGTA